MFLFLYRLFDRVCGRAFTLLSRAAFHNIGPRSVLSPPIRLRGERHIEIGTQVFIGPDCWLEVVQFEDVKRAPVISIGDETSIAGSCTITAFQAVLIEPRVLMARNVYISDHTHGHGLREKAIKDQGISNIAAVRICEGAWLGQNVVVCPGVTIGRNAVIGANSVVRDNVPDYCVAAGCPAKVIRQIDQVKTS